MAWLAFCVQEKVPGGRMKVRPKRDYPILLQGSDTRSTSTLSPLPRERGPIPGHRLHVIRVAVFCPGCSSCL